MIKKPESTKKSVTPTIPPVPPSPKCDEITKRIAIPLIPSSAGHRRKAMDFNYRPNRYDAEPDSRSSTVRLPITASGALFVRDWCQRRPRGNQVYGGDSARGGESAPPPIPGDRTHAPTEDCKQSRSKCQFSGGHQPTIPQLESKSGTDADPYSHTAHEIDR